jgi:hypothetical protein
MKKINSINIKTENDKEKAILLNIKNILTKIMRYNYNERLTFQNL